MAKFVGWSDLENESCCEDGCVETGFMIGTLLQGTVGTVCEDANEAIDFIEFAAKVSTMTCFREVKSEDYGHPEYAVLAYAASKGHIECIKKIYEMNDEIVVKWHTDLALATAEAGHLDCLKYIVEKMGQVNLDMDLDRVEDAGCRDYIEMVNKESGVRSI